MNTSFIGAIVIAIAGALLFVVVVPQYDLIAATQTALQEHQAAFNERRDVLEKVKKFATQYDQRQEDIKKIGVFLPQTPKNDQIISSIEAAGRQAGVQINSVTLGAGNDTAINQYHLTSLSIDAVTSYESLFLLLRALEQNLRLYDINQITVSRNETNKSANLLNVTLRMNAYSLK